MIILQRSGSVFGFRDLFWISPGSVFHFQCHVPVLVRTTVHTQTYREHVPVSYRIGGAYDRKLLREMEDALQETDMEIDIQ
jgi:hypothetical protein